ncbi:Maf family protein [Thalassospiraceae bacterium LMO-SO8]|nr:Maf family protein [Alphaproteobacteria bacterium LMO-S08]WND77565.1 Maf family protein [Thalassospiraceae bacterium LMO-SO8]
MTAEPGTRLVLASGSRVRADMLRAAGLGITVDPADVDEPEIEADCRQNGMSTPDVALALAAAKASRVAGRHPGALVIGADQMLDLDGDSLRKPDDLAAAARTLERLAGRDHTLVSAVVLARDGQVIWRHHASARLTMRPLDGDAIADYLDRAGAAVLTSVGAYQLEGLGAQLFEGIEGDYFTILGLPLLALLGELRRRGETAAGLLG